jgi:hypothetical protein
MGRTQQATASLGNKSNKNLSISVKKLVAAESVKLIKGYFGKR